MADTGKRLGLIAAVLIAGSLATAYTDHFITTRKSQEPSFAGFSYDAGENVPETAAQAEDMPRQSGQEEAAGRTALGAQAPAAGETRARSGEESAPKAAAAFYQAGAEDAAEAGPKIQAENQLESGHNYDYWQRRFQELDSQIQNMRDSQTDSSAVSIKSLADTELNLWEKELGSLYGEIMEQLSETEQEDLAGSQREWMNERDAAAEKAIPSNSGSSIETAEYTASLAASTRSRAYGLLEEYREYL